MYENYSPTSSLTISSQEKCKFRGYGNHVSSKCQKVSDQIVRKTILKKQGNCFVCLKHGHISRNCPSNYRCFKCSKDQNYNHVWKSEEKNKQVTTDTKHTQLNNHLYNQKSNVLLRTAQANVPSLNGRGINGRLLAEVKDRRILEKRLKINCV